VWDLLHQFHTVAEAAGIEVTVMTVREAIEALKANGAIMAEFADAILLALGAAATYEIPVQDFARADSGACARPDSTGMPGEGGVDHPGAVSPDHIHMLLSAPAHLAPAKLVQYIEGRSSRKLQEEFPELRKRYWGQHLWARGYFCATVGAVDEQTIRGVY
jgi:hypothetical protein